MSWLARTPPTAVLFGMVLYVACLVSGRCESWAPSWTSDRPIDGFRVVASYPHDPSAFTQGLVFQDGRLYEGTGLYGQSVLRQVDLVTGRMLRETRLEPDLFGEGITLWGDQIIQLTWREQQVLVYQRQGLRYARSFALAGEGWGITHNGTHWIISDGSEVLRFVDPETHRVVRRLRVTDAGRPIRDLNELEYIEGEIWANIWHSDLIARIDPRTGEVLRYVDLSGLSPGLDSTRSERVLNGIAYDNDRDRLFVTGKNWPRLYEIELASP